ncbi:uncharacterized protein LOC126802293 [Argentina anserina]|uniref:uncharacterized protein LOC126802293 n=1 Tax=Argentina anserina TaxID=57926 RepID=UPI00217672BC|nr:uncharacterized protein LOC126802293 [Potentilla anserina]
MLCPVSATKSNPNWLDRLRSNKGFPAGDNLDLDHFLSLKPNSSSESSSPNAESVPHVSNRPECSNPTRDAGKGEALLGLMSTAISELFFIDGSEECSRLSGKKVPRKQTHPRVCVTSAANVSDNKDTRRHKSSGGTVNDVNDLMIITSLNLEKNKEVNEGEELEERGERELKGYSKSEVTVIDTSCEVWKTEKVVFRRKSVWKVREKKSKVRSFGRNKRKVVSGEEGDDGIEEKKKEAKVSDCGGDQCISLNPIEEVSHTTDNLNDRGKEYSKDNVPDSRKDLDKGFPSKPRTTIKNGSSVVFIKGIRTDEKNEGKRPSKCFKDSQRKCRE